MNKERTTNLKDRKKETFFKINIENKLLVKLVFLLIKNKKNCNHC